MDYAIQLAKKGKGFTSPNPMVGCVIVHNNTIIGQGWHQKAGAPHAEVNAIESVQEKELLKTATLYVTLEPCSMCAGLIVHSRVARVVYGATEPKAGVAVSRGQFFSQDFLNHRVLIEGGLLAAECSEMLSAFFRARRAAEK